MKLAVIYKNARLAVIELLDAGIYKLEMDYTIYLNDEKYMASNKIIQSVYNLKPDTDYRIEVRFGEGTSLFESFKTDYEFVTLNVKDFGAKGDGESDDTLAIQAAVMACPKNSRVYIPKGVYRFVCLYLKSDLTIELAEGAVLLAFYENKLPVLPGRIESYDETSEYIAGSWEGNPLDCFVSIISGHNASNVVLCGRGTIDGCADFGNWWNKEAMQSSTHRPRLLFLNKCENIILQGLKIQNSPSWTLHPFYSENLRFLDLIIESPKDSHNTDGLDPESCKNVEIAGVYFSVGDDCIAIKSGKIYMGEKYNTSCEHIKIRQSCMRDGHGAVTLGSEIAAGVFDCLVENCLFIDTDRGLRIKTRRGRGEKSALDVICFQNIMMDGVKTPMVVNSFYYCGVDGKTEYVGTKEKLPVDYRTPSVGKMAFRNITAKNCHYSASYFYGLPEKKIEEVLLENVKIEFAENPETGVPAMMNGCEPQNRTGILIKNAKRAVLKNVEIFGCEGEKILINDVDEVVM